MISELKKNIDLVGVVRGAGIELMQTGSKHRGLCPFHGEKTPSFFVFQDNHFKCFGCGEHGDVIDFAQKLYGLSFPDALKHLGIKQGRITLAIRREITKHKRRAKLREKFNDWQELYCKEVSDLWFDAKALMAGVQVEDLEFYATIYHQLPVWEYHREILIHGSDEEKYLLYQDVSKRDPKWKITLT